MSMLRTFIAIELDEELNDNLCRLQAHLSEQLAPSSVRWVRPEGIHLTLKFLGDTPEEKVEAVREALAQAATTVAPFSITVGGLGCFPDARRPRVVWVGLDEPTGALSALQDAVEAHVAPLGFPTEKRSFHPHLTLGRVQRSATKSEARGIGEVVTTAAIGIIDEMAVETVAYIRSDLRPSGAVYTTLGTAKLAAGRRI